MITLQFRVKKDGINVRPRGWSGDTASVVEKGLRSELSVFPRRGRVYQLSLDEAKSFILGLVVFAAACPEALQLNGVGQVMAFDGGFSLPRAPDKSPVSIDLWVEGEALCAQVVEGLWFDEDLVAGAPHGYSAVRAGVIGYHLFAKGLRALRFFYPRPVAQTPCG